MPNLETLSAAKINALLAKREAAHSALLAEVIAAGYGNYTGNMLRAIAEPAPIIVEHLAAEAARYEVIAELAARQRYQGNDRPIKRMQW